MRGLVLEGGGAKGAYQAGAIQAFEKRGIKFDGVAGTSIGAINAAFYASENINGMVDLWKSTDSKLLFGIESEIIDSIQKGELTKEQLKKGIDSIINIIKNKGVDLKNIRTLLKTNINVKKLKSSKIDFGLVTFNISNFKPIEIYKKDIESEKIIDYIVASAYLPGMKPEKIIDDSYYFDGGIYANCPIDMFLKQDYNEIYAIKAWRGKLKYKPKKGVKVHVISPKEFLGLIIDFSPKNAKYKLNLGYYDTLKLLDNLDGNKYYFKHYSNDYYSSLFDKKIYNKMIKKYSNMFIKKKEKDFIINMIEKVCEELKINRFKVYNIPYLLTKLKYLMVVKKESLYYEFIKEIKVNFE